MHEAGDIVHADDWVRIVLAQFFLYLDMVYFFVLVTSIRRLL